MTRYLFVLLCQVLTATASMAQATHTDWQISTQSYADPYHGVTLANGGIGILPWREPFSIRHVMLNHVFDAHAEHGISRVLPGLNPFVLNVSLDGRNVSDTPLSEWIQELDMRHALLRTTFVADSKARISYDIRALRNMPYAGVIHVNIEAIDDLFLSVDNTTVTPNEYEPAKSSALELTVNDTQIRYRRSWATARHRGVNVSASAVLLFDPERMVDQNCSDERNRISISLKKGGTFYLRSDCSHLLRPRLH
ncbi:hypothetical protein [Alistipes sp. An116]|uniref:hypothetical protein n=1 Tax=Alistipes sp. An116 TaxID=1965546 RepID=UPI0026A110E6